MRISIFGMGYVGAVSGACLAKQGHQVLGVDVNPGKVALINAGESPIVEEGMAELMADVVGRGAFAATADAPMAVHETDLSFVSVGTPSEANGALSLRAVRAVSEDIGRALKDKPGPHVVVYRSTILPGTTEDVCLPLLLEHSGRTLGDDLEVAFNPEFLREGSSIRDFHEPPFTILGGRDGADLSAVESIYAGLEAELIRCPLKVAESVKYLCNMYHALKVGFANEAGRVLADLGIDARVPLAIFCRDTQLNISTAYLRPGYAFGGSCLPKDLRAFQHLARTRDVPVPVLDALLPSNARQVERAFRLIEQAGGRQVALLGLAFKGGTDDLRESPIVTLAEQLIGKGYELKIYDGHVNTARLVGSNREFIQKEIPHIDRLLQGAPEDALAGAEVIVVANADRRAVDAVLAAKPTVPVVDLQGVGRLAELPELDYQGIAWPAP
jgi:GDP-mannose 6-dehydrogenase